MFRRTRSTGSGRNVPTMFLTGGSGFLGRHLTDLAPAARWRVVAPASDVVDVRRRDETIDAVRRVGPAVVVHLAYRKDDRTTIVEGSRNVAEAARRAGAHLVHVSTDVVFGGRDEPYTEGDPPDPVTAYGIDKLDAEREVTERHPSPLVVRTSLLLGTDRLAPAQLQLAEQVRTGFGEMRFFVDEYRCPSHAGDVAAAISALARRPEVVGVLHVAGPQVISRAELARMTARHLGLPDDGIPTSSIADSGLVRPARVVLDVSRAASLGVSCRPVGEFLGDDGRVSRIDTSPT